MPTRTENEPGIAGGGPIAGASAGTVNASTAKWQDGARPALHRRRSAGGRELHRVAEEIDPQPPRDEHRDQAEDAMRPARDRREPAAVRSPRILPFGISWPELPGRLDDMFLGDPAGLRFAPGHQRAIAEQVDHARHAARIPCTRSIAFGMNVTAVDPRATHSRCVM